MRRLIVKPRELTRKVGSSGGIWCRSGVGNGEIRMRCVNGVVDGCKSSGLVESRFERF